MAAHAFLIMAHRDPWLLSRLLELLDDPANDIYLHVDRRSKSIDVQSVTRAVRSASLTLTRRTSVFWGGFTQVEAELLLLRAATERPHEYYHLMSGADLPLVTQGELRDFFAEHRGREFVHFTRPDDDHLSDRVRKRHLFADRGGAAASRLPVRVARRLEAGVVGLQDRLDRDVFAGSEVAPMKGAQWFSITDALARHVLERERWIRRTFGRGLCADEYFLQTLVHHSKFRDRLITTDYRDDYRSCARKIDWQRGFPHVWTVEDKDELFDAPQAGFMFARKFDSEIDRRIVELLYQRLT